VARILIDTNVLAYRINPQSPHQSVSENAITVLRQQKHELLIVPQTLYELWVVLTRPASKRGGLGRTPQQALTILREVGGICRLCHDTSDIFSIWGTIVSRYQVTGALAHDARLVAAMKVHNIDSVLTFNLADFNQFTGENITVIDPTTIR
jgi:predicted nucleic acid-binding protein